MEVEGVHTSVGITAFVRFTGFIFCVGFALMETLVGFARTDRNEAI